MILFWERKVHVLTGDFILTSWSSSGRVSFTALIAMSSTIFHRFAEKFEAMFYVVEEMNIWRFSGLHLWLWCFTICSILNVPISDSTTSQTATDEYCGSRFISKLLSAVWTASGVSPYDLVFFQIAHLMLLYLRIFHSTIVHLSSTCQKVYIVHV